MNTLNEYELKQIKYHLIGTITSDNKREVNRQLRKVDKLIKEIKQCTKQKL